MSKPTEVARGEDGGAGTGAEMESWSSGLDLPALANEYGTPLYIIDSDSLRSNFASYLRLVDSADRIRYPVKANPSTAILEIIAELGGGADCAAKDEIWAALEAGIPIERITYNSPAPEAKLAMWLLESGATVVADSVEGLDDLRAGMPGPEFAGRLFVRVSPGGLPGYSKETDFHRYTAHGGAKSAFGIPSEDLADLLESYPLPVTGLHMHVGTQMDNLEAFVAAVNFLHGVSDFLEQNSPHRFSTVNLGGGLGIPFFDDQTIPSIEDLAEALRPLRRDTLTYEVEPGNSLVGNAVGLLAGVAAVKAIRGRRWAIIDVGTDQLMKFTIVRWEHQIDDADHRPLPREGPDSLAGPLCFAGDVILPNTRLDGVKRGDPLLIRHAGAYCEAVSSRFNGRRGPAHIMIETDGSVRQVRRREDLFFEPRVQGYLPVGLEPDTASRGEPLPQETIEALQSPYLHTGAADETYKIVEGRQVGDGAYWFEIEADTPVDFIGAPFAIRITGDAAIVAVGHLVGWQSKAGPIWATHVSLTYRGSPPVHERFPCRVVVGGLRVAPSKRIGYVATVRFELGSGEVTGLVRVAVPADSLGPGAGA